MVERPERDGKGRGGILHRGFRGNGRPWMGQQIPFAGTFMDVDEVQSPSFQCECHARK